MPKPPVKIGDIYESKDKREEGRRVRVESAVPGTISDQPNRWVCVRVFEGRANRNHSTRGFTKAPSPPPISLKPAHAIGNDTQDQRDAAPGGYGYHFLFINFINVADSCVV